MTLEHFLLSHARGQGKTHNLALLVKSLDGTLVVRDKTEAERISKTYGIHAIPFDINPDHLIGTRLGITYVDPDAMGCWVWGLEGKIERLTKALEFIMGKVEAAQLSLEQICPSCCAGDVKEQLQRDVADIERILGDK